MVQWRGHERRTQTFESAFTLIELMVVLVLVSLAVGMTLIGMDGVTQRGRLRSALGEISAFDRLARTEALCDGRPRLLEFDVGTNRCVVKEPEVATGEWTWSAGRPLLVTRGVTVEAVVTDEPCETGESIPAIRIRSDGTSPHCAVALRSGRETAAVVTDGITGIARYVFDLPDAPFDRSLFLDRLTGCHDDGVHEDRVSLAAVRP